MEAIILAGGQGTRLREAVPDVPKAMVSVAGRPFLEYILDYLIQYKISRVIVSVGYLKEQIIDYFKDSYRGLKISYAIEDEPLGTGGGIKLAMSLVTKDQAFVVNGDTLFKVNLHYMFEKFIHSNHEACLALKKLGDTGRYGTVEFDNNLNIRSFKEKKLPSSEGFINGGIYLLNKEFFLSHRELRWASSTSRSSKAHLG